MQISSRFTIAVHILIFINTFEETRKVTSDFIASSVNVNPVIVRRLLLQLKAAGIVTVARGSGGASIARPLGKITLLDVYNAVECVGGGTLFHFHENPNPACPVGRSIHQILDGSLAQVQSAMEGELKKITLANLARTARPLVQPEK